MTTTSPLAAAPRLDYAALAAQLRTLGEENRLRLLSMLREPKVIGELLLPPGRGRQGERPERPITRQSVLDHIRKLESIGLVRSQPSPRLRANQLEYVALRSPLFALLESFREVLEAQPPVAASAFETIAVSPHAVAAPTQAGPRLVLVHGAEPGRTFPLHRDALSNGRGWILGRKASCHVCLDYDPFASGESAEIIAKGEKHRLLDLRTARNGTWLNWQRLPLGADADLRTGDIIGVGRSLLVFRAD